MKTPRIFKVSEITSSIRSILETHYPFIQVSGEISNLRKPRSGHLYFTLKDDKAQIKAVLFVMQQRYLNQALRDGQQVICSGRISVYEPRGDYQLIVDGVNFHGAGLLQKAFEQLKNILDAEGLFDPGHKKALPPMPQHLTLVTSPNGAAVHDFIKIAQKRFPGCSISVYPVSVQGETAADEIVQAIEAINDHIDTELIVLCRGGGSLEDLQAFNEERTARAIYNSQLPVVNAVGHEIDFTIADFAADLRAPTPSSAAELILPDAAELKTRLSHLQKRMYHALNANLNQRAAKLALYRKIMEDSRRPLESLLIKLDYKTEKIERAMSEIIRNNQSRLERFVVLLEQHDPRKNLAGKREKISALQHRIIMAERNNLERHKKRLSNVTGLLNTVSPLATLARGYAIVKNEQTGNIIRESNEVQIGDEVEILLHKGSLNCEVTRTKPTR
ncbi:MAG: exodeoxyribonuclease VII large subunit [Desulfobulbaceae bacterium]|nr:exodeoxyribonuclease VII large subunit [Desulfobulbaceae bacterium]